MLKKVKKKNLTNGKFKNIPKKFDFSEVFRRHKDAQKSTCGEDDIDENVVPLNKTYLMAKTMGWTPDNCFSQTSLNENGKHL